MVFSFCIQYDSWLWDCPSVLKRTSVLRAKCGASLAPTALFDRAQNCNSSSGLWCPLISWVGGQLRVGRKQDVLKWLEVVRGRIEAIKKQKLVSLSIDYSAWLLFPFIFVVILKAEKYMYIFHCQHILRILPTSKKIQIYKDEVFVWVEWTIFQQTAQSISQCRTINSKMQP